MLGITKAVEGLFGGSSQMTPAVQPFSDPVDLVNQPAGQPTQERWPGAVDPSDYGPNVGPGVNAGLALPGDVTYGADTFPETLPTPAQGGGYQDTAWMSGHDAPVLPWDSSAGAPFAPSGPVNPDLHAQDTGGVYVKEHVAPAAVGTITRHTGTAQTYNRIANTLDTIGQTAPNGRTDMDQSQSWIPQGGGPRNRTVGYAERPIYNNVAYENVPVEQTGSIYTPDGSLSDRAVMWDQTARAYTEPADPYVQYSQQPQAADNAPTSSGGWLLG
jgi:hypothetical protein